LLGHPRGTVVDRDVEVTVTVNVADARVVLVERVGRRLGDAVGGIGEVAGAIVPPEREKPVGHGGYEKLRQLGEQESA
jgi:hypothetical protein